jgi:hypothetical protein
LIYCQMSDFKDIVLIIRGKNSAEKFSQKKWTYSMRHIS